MQQTAVQEVLMSQPMSRHLTAQRHIISDWIRKACYRSTTRAIGITYIGTSSKSNIFFIEILMSIQFLFYIQYSIEEFLFHNIKGINAKFTI